ncbi:MAG TPA: hypothetical protein VK961_19450, partial [Chthoniobacter sp.]|nr:hypothetical protein [Chthoniobacter sp.]
MARFPLAPIFGCLLVWTMVFAPPTGNGAEGNPEVITKEWKIPRDLIPGTGAEAAKTATDSIETARKVASEVAKSWLIANGVVFNGAASATYVLKSSRLIVRNTQDQLDAVEKILHIVEPPPPMVDIECRLVEVERVEFKSLSFDQVTKTLNSPAKKSSQDILSDARGAHSLPPKALEALLNPLSNAGTITGVFTDPQFQMVVRALAQKKGADLLTAPGFGIKSGGRAVIRFVHQYSNPPEDVPPQVRSLVPPVEESSAVAGKKASAASPVSRKEGNLMVTLEVEPVVGPDGYTIDLNLTPQVTESDDFVSYMSPFRWMNPSFGPAGRIVTPQFAPAPVLSTRKVTTSVSVFDGSTVMLSDLFGRLTDGPPE